MVRGFVAGYNHYLSNSDSDDWPAECRDAAWVRPIDEADLLAYYGWRRILFTEAAISSLIGVSAA